MQIYGIDVTMPPAPPKERIEGYGLSEKKQKFKRIEIPESFYEIEYDEDDVAIYDDVQVSFIRSEFEKIKHGYWFYNKGEQTYITGDYYFYLNYWMLEHGGLPEYRDADRKWFLF
jgi:hypothetical protein